MIQSMTGYAVAERVEDGVSYALEVWSVNHRYLKLSVKLPDDWQFAEGPLEKIVRARVGRGSLMCVLRVRGEDYGGAVPINLAALQHYVDRFSQLRVPAGVNPVIDLAGAVQLPGVTHSLEADDEARRRQIEFVEQLAAQALEALIEMRRGEGQALRADLFGHCAEIRTRLAQVANRAPFVIEEYHERLRTRVATLMQEGGFELAEDGLAREVAVFAERCDISEELSRLDSHLDQFVELCERDEPIGRTLEFLTQELLREANTIASKCNDSAIARCVVEVKGLIDRLKEQVQNVE